jgi:ribosomal protein L11 methyltransferase
MNRHAGLLETVSVVVPADAVPAYESAIGLACSTVGLFIADEAAGTWRVEGVKPAGHGEEALQAGLAVAAAVSGVGAALDRTPTEAEGWLARVVAAFPEQTIGRRFAIRGTHVGAPRLFGRVTLTVDAGLAFGSGEHGSTRGCLRALEAVAYRRPRRVIDMGSGSGILAMAAAGLLRRPVLAVDHDPWSVRVTAQNAAQNGMRRLVRARRGDGWRGLPNARKFDLVFANILARPLCLMARDLAAHLAPGGMVILAGLLAGQIPQVLAAHRRQGLRLQRVWREGDWATMLLHSSSRQNGGTP